MGKIVSTYAQISGIREFSEPKLKPSFDNIVKVLKVRMFCLLAMWGYVVKDYCVKLQPGLTIEYP